MHLIAYISYNASLAADRREQAAFRMALKHSLRPSRAAATAVEPLLATAGRSTTAEIAFREELSSSVAVGHVYLAGGGEGDACLESTVLSKEQVAMFQR